MPLAEYRNPEIPKSRNHEIPKSRNPEIPESRNPGITECRNPTSRNPEKIIPKKINKKWKFF
jgi:hypothetical protein